MTARPLVAVLHWTGRLLLILLAAAAVAAVAVAIFGPPARARLYAHNELARFAPTAGHGVGQLAGETFFLGLVAFVGRRWLRLRL